MSSPPNDREKLAVDSLDGQNTAGPGAWVPSGDAGAGSLEARYGLIERLGAGGMGEVWRAVDRRLDRPVAIKRLQADLLNCQEAVDRFLTEARAVARLNHPGIVQVYDFGHDAQGPYLVMELVDGCSLADLLDQSGPLDPAQAVSLIAQVCDALGAAHQQGVVHRDIKPGNILVTRSGVAKLGDFGLARRQTADLRQTQSGAVLGTPAFMAPEQLLDARRADARSDLWSLAATLYQLVTGQVPRWLNLQRVPGPLRPVLLKGLDDIPDRRYQTAAELRVALSHAARQLPRAGPSEVPVQAEVVASPTQTPFTAATVPVPQSAPAAKRRLTWLWVVLAVLLLVPAACGGFVLLPLFKFSRETPASPSSTLPETAPADAFGPSGGPGTWGPGSMSPGFGPGSSPSDHIKSIQERNRQMQDDMRRRMEEEKQRHQQIIDGMRKR